MKRPPRDIDTVVSRLDAEFAVPDIGGKYFPMLFLDGVPDGAVHAAGVSWLLLLGLEFGLSAIAEYPITLHATDQWKKAGRIFPDSVWFHPQTQNPWIAIEFERFEKGDENKILEKAQNLALSCHQSNGTIDLCVFVYWLRSGSAPKTVSPLARAFSEGFYRNGVRVSPPPCGFLIYKLVMGEPDVQCSKNHETIRERIAPWRTSARLVVKEIRKVGGNT